ncbi:MAG: hypothetical protein [Olavius algarvensis Gamma 1 endosymbiont]|nr:MAG: hypothetical protein [Olavius algarvensis Gamma 1 endosymbiont]
MLIFFKLPTVREFLKRVPRQSLIISDSLGVIGILRFLILRRPPRDLQIQPLPQEDEAHLLLLPQFAQDFRVFVNRVVPLDNFMIYNDIIRLDRPD